MRIARFMVLLSLLCFPGIPGILAVAQEVGVQGLVVTAVRSTTGEPGTAWLGDRIQVTVRGLAERAGSGDVNPFGYILYLNGHPLTGLFPEAFDPVTNELTYHLKRTETSHEPWGALLSGANPLDPEEIVRVSVGPEGARELPPENLTARPHLTLRYPYPRLLGFGLLIILVLLVFTWLANNVKNSWFREPVPAGGVTPQYSLARTQLAFWFFVILAAFLYILVMTFDLAGILTPQALILLGISASTTAAAGVIDMRQDNSAPAAVVPAAPAAGAPAVQAVPNARPVLLGLTATKNPATPTTLFAFHRFQMVVWTVILGGIFLVMVVRSLIMPELDATLLTLMGISAGTYVGLKAQE
jgi:hypothetical protein